MSLSLSGLGLLFVLLSMMTILHSVIIFGLIILVLPGLPFILIVLILILIIVLSILVDLLLGGLLECLGLLGLESAEHAYDLLDDLEHVADHGGGQLDAGVQGRRQADDEGLLLVGVREPLAHLILKQLLEKLIHQVPMVQECQSRVRVVSQGG
jgi:hypothetical protein